MAILLTAPHRMPFLAGSVGVAGIALWWLAQLAALHAGAPLLGQTTLPPAVLHGPAMIYGGFAPFLFGFLLTVFPRWMGQPDLAPWAFAPAGAALLAGSGAIQAGLWAGQDFAVLAGFAAITAGWMYALVAIGTVLRRDMASDRPPCWHAWSVLLAVLLGFAGILAAMRFLATGEPEPLAFANRVGMGGLLLPVFLTVAHRMVPFFAGNVVPGYQRWRPDWVLAGLWVLLLVRLGGELMAISALTGLANAGLALVTGLMCWKWWPRTEAPGLLRALIWGFVWAPAGFAFATLDNALLLTGRGPDHALMIGFAGSLLVGMVTRVTQGHSGRPLEMPLLGWLAFAAIQLAAATRILAAVQNESGFWLITAIALFSIGLLPWALRNGAIYLTPRRDGKPG